MPTKYADDEVPKRPTIPESRGKPETPLNRASLYIDLMKAVDGPRPMEEPGDPNNTIRKLLDALDAPGDMTVAEVMEHTRFYSNSCLQSFAPKRENVGQIAGIQIDVSTISLESLAASTWLDGLMHGLAWMAEASAAMSDVQRAEAERAAAREKPDEKDAPEPHDDEAGEPGAE